MISKRLVSNKLVAKLTASFLVLILLMGASYMVITLYYTNKFHDETFQRLNSSLASDLIEEKFQTEAPFLDNGDVNKALFGDLMHDMMAVNRGIEVYLLDGSGTVLYSVVLDHSDHDAEINRVDLDPIHQFIATQGKKFILGENPQNPNQKSIFSAAKFEYQKKEGYIYIILKSKELQAVSGSLLDRYFSQAGGRAIALSMLFVLLLGIISIWFLTKNLREIISTVKRFEEGDYQIRIEQPEKSDLSVLAQNFNAMADTIVQNMEKLSSVDKLRRELIANISHDLRTPLAVLTGYTETLQIKGSSLTKDELEEYLRIISTSAHKLSKLIHQLFEYSKLEAKQVTVSKEPFSLVDLVLDLMARNKVLAEEKNIHVELKCNEEIPLVFADLSLVERAIQNLIDNAIKFTPTSGHIELQINPKKETVEIQVSDNGIGIKESEKAYIFERYRQAKSTNKNEGSGLGLAIVKKIMDLHNTYIEVKSAPNQGSTFQFYLPIYN